MKDELSTLIGISDMNGFTQINYNDIVCCIADGSYTTIILADKSSHHLSKRLTKVEEGLPEELFIRVHHQYLVNKFHVKQYTKTNRHQFILTNGIEIPLAERRRKAVLKKFKVL